VIWVAPQRGVWGSVPPDPGSAHPNNICQPQVRIVMLILLVPVTQTRSGVRDLLSHRARTVGSMAIGVGLSLYPHFTAA
jgi:hypothetical protein